MCCKANSIILISERKKKLYKINKKQNKFICEINAKIIQLFIYLLMRCEKEDMFSVIYKFEVNFEPYDLNRKIFIKW